MLRTKPDVRFEVITRALLRMLTVLENISTLQNHDITITAGTEGKHMPGSKHYTGEALDIRTRDLSDAQRDYILFTLRSRLGLGYDVVEEFNPPHIHIEYDPS